MSEQTKPKCMILECDGVAKWKGLCGKCYHQAKTLIDDEETTWDELGAMGLCVQDDKRLLTAFRKAKESKPTQPPAG